MRTIKDFLQGLAAGTMLVWFPLLMIICSIILSVKYWFAAIYDARTGEETFFDVNENSKIGDFVGAYYLIIQNWMHGK